MLATNEPVCPSFVHLKSLRAFRQAWRLAFLLLALCLAASVPAQAQVSGQNVNMVSGTNWTNGDPFLQRQNEPSIAVSSRNSSHLLAGSNDYRTVDLPGLLGIDERGDAWLGLFKSFDGGRTWQSTLLPGFPLDGSPQGQASPIHGFQAASDPTVRAGTNGLFYYTGIAFNRGNNSRSAVFVSRFVDLNNKENGSAGFESGSMTNLQPRDTIKYVDTAAVAQGIVATGPNSFPTFLDKPWVATDIPRGSSTCTISVDEDGKIITQTIPAAPVYMTYTSFDVTRQFSTINFIRSLDCGATWSSPAILSRNDEPSNDAEHQGTVIAIDPSVPPSQPATVYVAWRRFASANDPGDPPAIFLAKSADGGAHWGTPFPVVVFPNFCIPSIQNPNPTAAGCPFDQIFTNASFRSNGYPALTVDSIGRVYVAWSQRDTNGDGKIMMGIAPGGRSIQSSSIAAVDLGTVTDDNGNAFSNLSGRGSQLMPSMTFAAGKLMLSYYDLRQDHTTGTFVETPSPNCDPLFTLPCGLGGQYAESRTLEGELAPPNPSNNPAVFNQYVADSSPLTVRRHTIDVMGAEAVPPPASSLQPPTFKAFRVTHYLFGSIPQLFPDVEQVQFNAPNLPLFVEGTAPFMGDYIDVSGTPQIVSDGNGGWTFNTSPTANPVFHATWTDNRDVVPPADGKWQNYVPPFSASNPGGQPSKFDPSQAPPQCIVGKNDGQTGMRNQNIYTAEISQGVILTSPQTSKPVLTPTGQPVQREFVVELRNATNAARSFLVTIPAQPPSATASFQQFAKQVAQTVKVNAFSSQSFPVFVVANAGSTVAFPSVLINAVENDGAPTPLSGSVLLNPDPTNPALANPDNATLGANQISLNEFYNPGLANPGLANPGLANPGLANPGLANPGLANPGLANPQVVTALNPGLANPGLANPGLANPGLANPGLANQALTDVSYTITNEGNTSASYTVQFFQSGNLPQGAQFQIVLSKLYFTQQAVGCQIQQVPTNIIVANVTNPAFVTNPNQLGNPGLANLGLQTPTLNLAPGDSGQITLRTNLSIPQVQSLLLPNLSPVAVSQGVNTVDVKQGIFTPPISLIITSTSTSLPQGEVRLPYNTALTSVGGNTGPRIWTIAVGSLPPGLQLNAASGAISGTPTQAGSFAFTAQVMDTGAPQHTATRDLIITILPPVTITTPSPALPGGVVGSPYTQTFSAAGGVSFYTWSSTGTLPPGLTLATVGTSGLLLGTPTASGTYNFTVKVTDAFGLFATAPYTILVTNPVPTGTQIQFVTQPANSVGGQAISSAAAVRVVDATGAVLPSVLVAMSFGTQACPAAVLSGSTLATTNATGIATFANLMIDRGQIGYTLLATAGNTTAVSNPFTVNGFCATGSLNTARAVHGAVTLSNGTVLVAGGFASQNTPLSSAEIYNPASHSFTATGNMNSPRAFFTATLLNNGLVLVTGGFGTSGGVLSTAELFDPSTNTFKLLPVAMFSARAGHVATLLASGKVLITGGVSSSNNVATAEVFDPATNTFTPTAAPMTAARTVHNATLLPNGKVLVTGGFGATGPLASAELYDPVANTFTAAGSMATARGDHASTLLYTGQVLVAGGQAPTGQGNATAPTATAELYDPSTGSFVPTSSASQALFSFNGRAVPTLPDGTAFLTDGPTNGQIFVPAFGTFQPTANLPSQQFHSRNVLLQDGTILLPGGQDANLNSLSNAVIYYSTAPLAPIAITTTSLSGASTGQPYTQVILERGGVGNLTWSMKGTLPAGMTFSNQGVLNGTPTVAGSFPLTFTLADSSAPAKTVSANFTLTVTNSPLVFTSSTVPTAVTGKSYSQPIPVVGGTQPYNATVTSGTLPPGLLLTTNGVLNGTPSGTGTFSFTVMVADSSTPTKTATQTLTMTVNTLVITTTVLPNGIVGVTYNAAINTAGGTLPLSFSLANTGFPPGLLIQQPSPGSSSGALAGKPSLAGTYPFSESVADSSNPQQTATQNYVLTIAPAGSAVPANVTFVSQPQNSVGGQTLSGGPVTVQVTDANNTPIPGTTVAMSLSGFFGAQVPCSVATLSGTLTTVTDGTGRATFSNLSIDRGGFNYTLMASTGSASSPSGPFSVQGFCPTGNLSTQRELHTQVLLGTAKSIVKFPLDPKGAYIFTNTNPAPPGLPDAPNSPLIIPLASLGLAPGSVISGVAVGDVNVCGFAGEPCFGEFYDTFVCGVFSSSNTLLSGGTVNRVPGAIAPNFNTAIPCVTGPTAFGGLATDIPQDFGFFGEQVTVPPGAAYLFVALADTFYADNLDPNGDFGLQLTINSPATNDKVLIAGGIDNLGNVSNTAELYDPATGTTSPTGNLSDPNGREGHISVLLPNGKVLLAGGVDNVSGALNTAELYDPAAGVFSPTGSMMHPRLLAEAVLLADGRVLVTGGGSTNVASNTAEIYDPATGLWTPTGNMTQGRIRHRMTLLPNGKVLVTGGRDGGLNFFGLSSAELFDPFANQGAGAFTAIGNMNSVRFVHGQSLLSNGTVLVAGGFDNTGLSVTSAEVFDPATNLFTLTGNMNIGRSRHSSTLLPDSTILETGGIDSRNGFAAPAPAELYLPTAGSFALTGSMTTGRELAGATLLPNGNVLVAGGDDAVNVLQSTELYFNPVVKEPIAITTTSIPNAFVGQPYVAIALEENSAGPITWSIVSGALPPGIKGNTIGTYGVAYGTPTTAGSFTFTVQVTDGISTATRSFTINVSLVTLAFTSNSMPAAGAGKPYSQPLPVVGGTPPYTATVTSGTLPPGLALGSNGVLSGTPSSAGSFTFTASVSDFSTPVQTTTQTLTIAVDTLFITTTALPGGMVGEPYNAVISTTGGTLPLTFSAANAAFPPGLAIQQPAVNSPSGALAGTPTTAGHFTFVESVVDSSTPAQTATQYYVMDIFPAGTTGVPASAVFLSQPQNSVGGQILTGSPIRVRVFDATNTPIVGASVALSFNGAPPCSSAVLSGTLTAVTNVNGIAVFPDLSIDRGRPGYTLLASAGSVSVVSPPFTVNGFCNIPAPVQVGPFAAATLLSNGKALITGGVDAAGNISAVAQLYDPITQTFAPTGSMHLARREQTSTLLADGRVLIAGGRGGTAVNSPATATAEIYDPVAGTFTFTATPMNAPRRLHTATPLADGTVLLAGGRGIGADQNTAEIFDPTTGSFTLLTATLATARETHTATLLPDGTALLAGGSSAGATLSSAEIYNPSTHSFAAVHAPMNSPRSVFNTLLLPTGKALLVGGISDSTGTIATATAELYDPSNATFTPTGSMATARTFFTANLLPSGQVLASGGLPSFTATSSGLATAEVYDPITGTFSQTGSLSASRAQQTSVTLNDGTVLVTQGASTGSDDDVYYSAAAFQITTPSLLRGATQGQPYSLVLLEQGGVGSLTWTLTAGSLPSGITLSPSGILSGTPTVFGAFLFTVQVTDSSVPPKTATTNYALLVNPFFQFFGTQLVTAFSGVAYSNPLPLIGGTPPYSSTLTSGVLPSGLMLANGVISGTTTAVGTYTLTFQATDSSVPPQSATATLTLGVTTPLVITTTTLPGGVPNSPYNATIATSGGLGTIIIGLTANALPPGLTMDSHGVISGTPTQTGTFDFTVVAADQSLPPQTATQALSIQVAGTIVQGQGMVSAWGGNGVGELGNGTNTNSNTPVGVSGLSGVAAIAAGEEHSLALKSDGTVWAWGDNGVGELGTSTSGSSFSNTAVQVLGSGGVGFLSGVTAITGGDLWSLALKSDGTVWAWGLNANGQLGNGTNTNSNTPVQVLGPGGVGFLTGVTAIAAGNHGLALKSDGTVWAWGLNANGQLGNGTNTNSNTPVEVSGLSGVTAIAAGIDHSLALKGDGTVWAWGSNGNGQLGNGTFTPSNMPVEVSGLTGVTAIAGANDNTSLALKSDGTVWAWGDNFFGQLGNGTNTISNTPVQVLGPGGVGFLTGVKAIASGSFLGLAVKSDGTVWAWGGNGNGQLGNGTNANSNTPVQVLGPGGVGFLTGVTAIAGGGFHSLALMGAAPASIKLNFFPNTAYNANTATMDATLGTTGYTIDTFETTTLIPGLAIQLSGGVTATTWTSLPNLFDGDTACPGLTSGQAWDGTDTASNLIANQVTNCSGSSGVATLTTFNYAPGATSFGIGLSNFQSVNPPSPSFPITNHELFVNGVDMGILEILAGAAWSPGLTRNAYLRIDGVNGGVITSVGFENLATSGTPDFLMFDHLAILPSR